MSPPGPKLRSTVRSHNNVVTDHLQFSNPQLSYPSQLEKQKAKGSIVAIGRILRAGPNKQLARYRSLQEANTALAAVGSRE